MKLNLIYKVTGWDHKTHTLSDIEEAVRVFDNCKSIISDSREHCNTVIYDRWPILERCITAYNGECFEDYKTVELKTYCFKNPKGKEKAL